MDVGCIEFVVEACIFNTQEYFYPKDVGMRGVGGISRYR